MFHDLAAVDVNVVDVTTGISSDGAGARLTFGAMALVNDQFLQNVRKQTHRGLEGRALSGFWTGGRCYGYATVTEENPPDREHPRKRSVIDPVQAALVVRVFRLFADGVSLKKIASMLNDEGLAAPNDGGRGNKNGHGWGHTTIRAMLCNERSVASSGTRRSTSAFPGGRTAVASSGRSRSGSRASTPSSQSFRRTCGTRRRRAFAACMRRRGGVLRARATTGTSSRGSCAAGCAAAA